MGALYLVDSRGQEQQINVGQIREEFLPKNENIIPAVGFDLDQTKFANDMGMLVYLYMASDPEFWRLTPEEFSQLLLPAKFQKALKMGKVVFEVDGQQKEKNLDPIIADLALKLHEDLCALYKTMKGELSKTDVTLAHLVIKEFVRKMFEMDIIMMHFDSEWFDAFQTFLMRFRFLKGHGIDIMEKLVQKVMAVKEDDPHRFLDLTIHSDLQGITKVKESDIQNAWDREKSPVSMIDTYVQPVQGIVEISRMLIEQNIPTAVVSANLKGIVKQIILSSVYAFIAENQKSRQFIRASRLQSDANGNLGPKLEKLIFGDGKLVEAKKFAAENGATLWGFAGDSPRNDGPTQLQCIENGGFAIVVAPTLEEGVRNFSGKFGSLTDDQQQRVIYVTYDKN